MKRIIALHVLAVLMPALNLQAQTTDTWKPSANPTTHLLWSEAANWSLGYPPGWSATTTGQKAVFSSTTLGDGACIVNSAAQPANFVIGDNSPGTVILQNGGSLTSSNYSGLGSWNAVGYNSMARLELQTGTTLIASNNLWIALNPTAIGTFAMNGGNATVMGMIGLGWAGGIGTALINAGTLNLAQWNSITNTQPSISALSDLDIRGGTVVINGDVTNSVREYVEAGRLTGYGGIGTVNYNLVTTDTTTQTVVTATSPRPGAGGPYLATDWPTNINPDMMVHYYVADGSLSAPNANWTPTLGFVTSSDSGTNWVTFQGLLGIQGTSTYFNIRDTSFADWNTNGLVDVLVQVYGDGNVLRTATDPNQGRRLRFNTGTSYATGTPATQFTVYGGTYATNANNSKWNWIVFTITNNMIMGTSGDYRSMGTIATNATGNTTYGGINGGTLRITSLDNGVNGLTVHAIAFGQHGAFGRAADVNQFAPPEPSCPPIADVNLVGVDFNAFTNHLQVINDPGTGQDVTFVSNEGPAGDQRKAVKPNGFYLNFGILDNYLGKPCNDNVAMKVCVDYYDDPAFAGNNVGFGPQAYATDSTGTQSSLPITVLANLQGTGRWIRQSWIIPSVNLYGVSTTPLTGGPQFVSVNGQVAVSRCEIAVMRTSGPLAGQDPLASCLQDPNVCLGVYPIYAELDLANGITNGVDLGNNGGDQTYVVEMAGPAGDQRLSVAPNYPNSYYLNFQIVTNSLGPDTQGNIDLAMVVTYYDDPALAGKYFWPQVWKVQTWTATPMAYMSSTESMVIQGTGKWREAYWEIGSVYLHGVGQTYAAARFQCNGPLHISRVRYAVIRPCGPTAGQNLLSHPLPLTVGPDVGGQVRLSWPYQAPQALLQSTPTLGGTWSPYPGAPVIENGTNRVLRFTPSGNQFFRLYLTPQ